jgi:hypothetical protein
MSEDYSNDDGKLPEGLVLRLDIEENGQAHLYTSVDDDQAVHALRDLADGLEAEGSTPHVDTAQLDAALKDLLGD